MNFYVYVLISRKDGRYYIGMTGDVHKRLWSHNQGFVQSTKHRVPLELVYIESFTNKSEALKREAFLKRQKGGDVFKKIIRK